MVVVVMNIMLSRAVVLNLCQAAARRLRNTDLEIPLFRADAVVQIDNTTAETPLFSLLPLSGPVVTDLAFHLVSIETRDR
jgi:hypothetical protein